MVVLVLERVPVGLRGELSRWMIEPKTGVFVGSVSALVRDKLWDKVAESVGRGGAIMAYSTNNEQGFAIQTWGDTTRDIIDLEGLVLAIIPADGTDTTRRSPQESGPQE